MKYHTFLIQLLCILFCSFTENVFPQENNPNEPIQIRVVYYFTQKAIKDKEPIFITDTMALDMGNNWSVYYDYHKKKRDSIAEMSIRNNPIRRFSFNRDAEALQKRLESLEQVHGVLDQSRDETMQIFKNRKKGEMIIFDKGPSIDFETETNYQLIENISPQEWKITRDTLIVLGYICNKGTSTFRGRTYHAWFTVDIPVNDGPWKLYGLPGLILRVEDENENFTFEAIGLQKVEGFEISFPTEKKIVPCNSLEELHKFRKNRFKNISIGFSDGNREFTYYQTKNPVTFNELEIE